MAVTTPFPIWKQYFRVAPESAFNTNTATADWNIGGNGGGATGWRDVPVVPGSVRFTPSVNPIFPNHAAGIRAMNNAAPVAGAYTEEGSLEMPVYPELMDPFFYAVLGSATRTPTAGAAALSSTAFASVATLDTQPDGTEQLKFVIASSTAASGAAVDIIQSGSTQETITIGTSAGSVDGDYYSQGRYDGSTNAITFSVTGTVTGGMVTVSGVDLNTNVFTASTSQTAPSLKIEEGGQPRGATNSNFYNGCVVPSLSMTYDRTAADGLLMATAELATRFPSATTAGTFGNAAHLYYYPLQAWSASLTRGGSAYDKVQGATINIDAKNQLFAVSSGNQQPSGAYAGQIEVTGTINALVEDATEWGYYTGQTVSDFHLTFTSPYNIVDSTAWSITVELTELYVENYTENVSDDLFSAELAFRTTNNSADGPVKITSVCGMPV